jgi:hypothetical protein
MDFLGSDHLPIQTAISLGHSADAPPSSVLKLNVSHLESEDFLPSFLTVGLESILSTIGHPGVDSLVGGSLQCAVLLSSR